MAVSHTGRNGRSHLQAFEGINLFILVGQGRYALILGVDLGGVWLKDAEATLFPPRMVPTE